MVVSRSSDCGLQVVSVLDWQHATILPTFLLVSMRQCLQNYDDSVSQPTTRPSLPENFDDLNEAA